MLVADRGPRLARAAAISPRRNVTAPASRGRRRSGRSVALAARAAVSTCSRLSCDDSIGIGYNKDYGIWQCCDDMNWQYC